MLRYIAKITIFGRIAYQTTNFSPNVYLGDPINIVNMLGDQGAQEVFISFAKDFDFEFAKQILTVCRMPVCVSGVPFEFVGSLGSDKYVLGYSSFSDQRMLSYLVGNLGVQAVSLSVDYRKINGIPMVVTGINRNNVIIDLESHLNTIDHSSFGELILTAVDRDGLKSGSDEKIECVVPSSFKSPILLAGGVTRDDVRRMRNRRIDGFISCSDISLVGTRNAPLVNDPINFSMI